MVSETSDSATRASGAKKSVFAATAVAGLVVIGLSFYWNSPYGPEVKWTEDEARELSDASTDYHQRAYEHVDEHSSASERAATADSATVNQARQRFEAQKAKLQRARFQRDRTTVILRWVGIAVAAIGVFGFLLAKSKPERDGSFGT